MKRTIAVGILLVSLVGIDARGETRTAAVDLVGEWSGVWAWKHSSTGGGRYYLTITKITGRKVFGRIEIVGRGRREFAFVGTLDGNRLTWGKQSALTVSGDQMRGTSFNRDISLSKRKS